MCSRDARLLRDDHRLIRVKPCFFLKQEKTLVFQKNQEKDVWHALLSFQGTGPRGFLPADDAVPPAFSQEQIYRPKTETLSLCDIPHVCQWFRCPSRTPLHRMRDRNKEPRTLAGMRNIGPVDRAVKMFRRKWESQIDSVS